VTVGASAINPFPGLRPFEPDEDHLFFGRENETDELLRRLRSNRFLSVVGTSGCGKSSLIRCGLIPSLHGGSMAKAGSSWRVSIFRPGEDPIGHLATALALPDVIGATDATLVDTGRVLIDAALRRGTRGLIDAVQLARIPPEDNLLVVVDQFEELFRFERSRQSPRARDEAIAFVKLLLDASGQTEVPIYVALTMRSDFIGDCMEYPGLPEAFNASQYLVPRLTRDELRSAITGPVAVAGGEIAPRLVQRLLNDVGNDQDRLPVLQHALMRTWDFWSRRPDPRGPIDLADYEAVGSLGDALSRHAEEAYLETGSDRGRLIAERIFRALTDVVADPRGVRRPCSVAELTAVAEGSEAEVVEVIEIFRRPGRSFLMPPAPAPLDSGVIVDISHESLMRCWTRLIGWAEGERVSANRYLRLTKAAAWFEEGSAGLWRDPELELGLKWRRENRPTEAWARRYDDSFARAMRFLDRSESERDRLVAERRADLRRKWRQLQWVAVALAVLLAVAATMAYVARRESARARVENDRAEENLRLARAAVDESLVVAEREPSLLGVDVPAIVGFRRELLEKAQGFYQEFIKQSPANADVRAEMALAFLRLGNINRALGASGLGADDYRRAIERFEALAREYPARTDYRQNLANAYNWLGESLRRSGDRYAEAKAAYESALRLHEELRRARPAEAVHQQDLARTYYNRGILYADHEGRDGASVQLAEADFREGIRLLESLARGVANPPAAQELGRAYNNLASLLAAGDGRLAEARALYSRAIGIHEGLVAKDPSNREYAMELVQFYNNDADVLRELGETDLAGRRSEQALEGIENLSRPAPSVGIERADTLNLRGRIVQARSVQEALALYRQSLEMYQLVERDGQAKQFPEFHQRVGDLIVNVAAVVMENGHVADAGRLLSQVLEFYLVLAGQAAASGTAAEARGVLDCLARVLPGLSDEQASQVRTVLRPLQAGLETRASAK
jgi:tetratricopeptide (TPR) repeat protein